MQNVELHWTYVNTIACSQKKVAEACPESKDRSGERLMVSDPIMVEYDIESEDLRQRVADFCAKRGNQLRLAEAAKLNSSVVSKFINRESSPTKKTERKLEAALNQLAPQIRGKIRRKPDPPVFGGDQLFPSEIELDRHEAEWLLERRKTDDPYWPIRLALLDLSEGKHTLPDRDAWARMYVTQAEALLNEVLERRRRSK